MAALHSMWDLNSQPRMKLHPLRWKRGVLTAAPPVKPLTVAVKRRLAMLTDIHSGLAPEQQLQTLWFTVQTTVVQGCVPQGRLLIQVSAEKQKHSENK